MHSHRQRRRSNSSGGPVAIEIPIPVCITLYHCFPHPEGVVVVHHTNNDDETTDSAESSSTASLLSPPRWYRLPEHSKRLLRHPLLLEILDSNDHTVLYSSIHPGGTIHPSWDLLDERFLLAATDADEDDVTFTKDEKNLRKEAYRNMTVRISLLLDSDTKGSNNSNQQQQEQLSKQQIPPVVVLAEAPLYPSLLQRLVAKSSLLSSPVDPSQLLPMSLPINSLVIFFSDDSMRVPCHLYQFLVDRHVLNDNMSNATARMPTTSTSSPSSNHMVEDFDRFSDDVFATLDQVKTTSASPSAPTSATATLSPPAGVRKPRSDISLLEAETEEQQLENDQPQPLSSQETTSCPSLMDEGDQHDATTFPQSQAMTSLEDLRKEQLELQLLLEEEEQAWKEELQSLQEDKRELEYLVSNTQAVEAETAKIREATYQEMMSCQQAEFSLEAHRIKLISELRILYPIQMKSDQRYLIRGLELPRDIHSATVSEDEVSAALGYVTHLVSMMSKYLAVSLRYRLYCSSSRSAISIDGVAVAPLFTSRAVERDEVDRGLQLLHRNVDCLARSRAIGFAPQTHLLAKIQRIYDKIIDGC